MARFKVVLVASDLPPAPAWVTEQLAERSIDLVERRCTRPDEVAAAAHDADAVWVAGGSRVVTAELLPSLPRCAAILRTGSGTDNVPVEAATRRGIVVGNTPEAMMHAVAEHTLGLLITTARQIALQDRLIRQHVWDGRRAWPRRSFRGRVLGLVGFGRIARLVASKASGLELTILAWDPLLDARVMSDARVASVGLDELLAKSDFVSVHVPLTDATHHLIGERQLRHMKRDAILINTARGPIIDESALIRALADRWISAAGLDVLETEPPDPANPLLALDNVVLTPHVGSYSDVYVENSWTDSIRTLVHIAERGVPLWCVNPQAIGLRKTSVPAACAAESAGAQGVRA